MIDYNKLYFLRKNTMINPFDMYKIDSMKIQAERDTAIINKAEHCHLGVDYGQADEYEYSVRFKLLLRKLLYSWIEEGKGESLIEYAEQKLNEFVYGKREEVENEIVRQRVK